jgi:hemerythrin-like domain-containing protein
LILALFLRVERLLDGMSLQRILGLGVAIESLLMAHALEEDSLLFHTMPQEHAGLQQAQSAMDAEHKELRRQMEALRTARNLASARKILRQSIELTREHFAVEERVLFRVARGALGASRLRELGAIYARRRGLDVTA